MCSLLYPTVTRREGKDAPRLPAHNTSGRADATHNLLHANLATCKRLHVHGQNLA